jgi:hypothetical protein
VERRAARDGVVEQLGEALDAVAREQRTDLGARVARVADSRRT